MAAQHPAQDRSRLPSKRPNERLASQHPDCPVPYLCLCHHLPCQLLQQRPLTVAAAQSRAAAGQRPAQQHCCQKYQMRCVPQHPERKKAENPLSFHGLSLLLVRPHEIRYSQLVFNMPVCSLSRWSARTPARGRYPRRAASYTLQSPCCIGPCRAECRPPPSRR